MTAEPRDKAVPLRPSPFLGRTPPHNIEAEKALLGAIFINNRAYEKVSDFLKASHFALKQHGRIFDACRRLIERGQIADPVTLRRYFEAEESLAEINGPAYLGELAASAATVVNAGEYGRLVHDLYLKRELIALGEDVVNRAYEAEVDVPAKNLLAEADRALAELSARAPASPGGTPRLRAETVADFLALDIPTREMVLAPFLPTQGLAMLFAKRGVGKTHLSLGIAYAVATGTPFLKWTAPKPRKVLFVDGEMPGATIQERLAAIVAAGEREPPAADYLRIVTPDRQERGIPDLCTEDGQAAIEEVIGDSELVILDNQSCLFRAARENEADDWAPCQEWLLSLRRRGVSGLLVHHAGKGGDQRGTSRREDVLDAVVSLKRPADYHPSEGARFEVHYEKSRGFAGDEARPFEAKLEVRDDAALWTTKDLDESRAEQVAEMLSDGMSQKEISEALGIDKSNVSRHARKARQLGLAKDEQGHGAGSCGVAPP